METEIYQSTLEALPEKERLKITKQIRKRQIENYIQNTANDNLELGRPRKPNKKNTKVGFNSNYRVQEAIEDGDDLQVQKLAKERFDPNFTTGNGLSLLHKCCIEGNVTSAEIIISRGADVNKQDDDWWTPLHVACYRDNPELIQLLLNNGSNVKILDVDNNFPIDYAPLGSESWSIMCNHHNDNGIDKEMLKKIRMEGSSCVKLEIEGFVNHGVNVSKPLTEGITWLHIVCANGYKKALKLLLDNRADVNAVDYNGWTPLHVAAKYGEKRVVEILMNNEARTDVIDVHGFRPVDVAATEDIQKLIVEAHKKRLISSTTSQESGLQFEDEEDDDSYVTKAIRPKELPLSKAEKLMEAQMRFQYLEDDKIHRLGTHKGNDHSDNGEIVSSILRIRQSKEACLPSTGPSDDLIGFELMTEKLMVDTLEERFRDHKIYTDIGDILLAVNPFETLPYYSKEVSKKYNTTEKLTHLPPHIYATAERCLRGLKASRGPQCCIIGGESGTGKTESCKCIIKHLVDVSDAVDNQLSHKIEQINPLLEAFGNAQTVMNDNSSRYAKLLEIKFNSQNIISGACLKEYLLEKCRVVHQSEQELNFHIFYWMLAGLTPEECRSCLLDKNKPYRYLGGNVQKTTTHMTLDNKQKFWEVKESLKFLGFTQDDLTSVINVLAAILHIGNITFSKDPKDNAQVTNQEALRNVSVILRIPFEDLMSALVEDVIITRGEQTKIFLTVDQAIDSCDALAKTLYSRLFSWIVNGINQMVQPDEDSVNSNLSISILDLFGFENLQTNSFEQMCINIANEQLQMYFVDHVFKLEEADCVSEGIESSSVTVPWTDLAISLFLEKGSGVLALLDEECAFPKASDKTVATKLHHGPGKKFKRIYKEPRDGGVTFTVVHYAGAITYTLTGILDKNRDKLRHHLSSTMRSSSNLLFKDLFQTRLSKMGSLTTSNRQVSMKKNNKTSNVFMKMKFNKQVRRSRIGQPNKHATKRPPATMSYHFRNSLKDMMTKISYCQTHFVRCFKPNSEKKPSLFVRDYIQAQLRYTGVLETVRIRKNGYAHRIRFVDFLDRYKCLSGVSERRNKRNISIVNQITNILTRWRIENFRIGKTKVFLRHGQTERLDTAENYFLRMIIKAQSVIRGFGVRRKMVVKYSKRERNMSHIEVFGNLIGRNQQRVFQLLDVQRDHDTVKFQRQQKDDVEAAIGFLDSVIENEPLYINLPTREEVDSHYRQQDDSVSDQSDLCHVYEEPRKLISQNADADMNQHRVYVNEMDSARNFPPSPREMYSTMMYEDMRHNSNNRSMERIPPVLPPRSPDTRLSNSTGTSSRGSSISEPDLGQGLYQDSHYSTPSPPISPAKKHPHHPSANQPYSYVPNASLLQQQKRHSEQDYSNGATDPHSFYYSPAENTYASYIHNEDVSQQYEQSPRHMQIRNSVKKLTNGVPTSPVLRRSSVGQSSDSYSEQKSKCKNVGSPKLPKKFQQRSASVDCQMSVPPPPNFPAPPPPLQVKDRYLAGAQSTRCPSPPLPPPPPELHAGQAANPPPPPPVSTIPGRQTRPAGREEAVKKSRSGSLSRSNSGVDAAIIQEIGTIKLKPRSQSTAGILNGSSSVPLSIPENNGSVGGGSSDGGGNELGRIQLKKTKTDKLGDIYQTAEESVASSPPLFTPPFVPVCDIDDFPLPPPPEELLPVKPPAAPPVAKQANNSGPRSPIVKQSPAIPAVPKSPTVKHTPYGSAPKSPVIKHVPLTPKSPVAMAPPVSPKSPIVTQASPVSLPTPASQVVSPSNGHSKSKDTTNAKMDFEIPADIDLSQCPGLVPTPAHCPVWKREMIDKKNKDRVEEYVREILQEREEQEKWKNVPEWKRKILKQKADEDRAKAKAMKEGTAPLAPPEQKTTQQELLHAGQGHRDDNFVPAAMNIDPEEFESMPPWKQELLTKRKNIPVTFNNEFNPDEEEEPQPQRQEYNLDVKMAS